MRELGDRAFFPVLYKSRIPVLKNLHRDGEISVRDMSCIQQDI